MMPVAVHEWRTPENVPPWVPPGFGDNARKAPALGVQTRSATDSGRREKIAGFQKSDFRFGSAKRKLTRNTLFEPSKPNWPNNRKSDLNANKAISRGRHSRGRR